MTALEEIQAAQRRALVNHQNKPTSIEIGPPLTADDITELEAGVGKSFPAELREVLSFCSTLECGATEIDFTGRRCSFGSEDIFPHGLPISGNGCGDFWVLDITADSRDVVGVFFACHDPPVIVYEYPTLAEFLSAVFRQHAAPQFDSTREESLDRKLNEIWRQNAGVISRELAMQSNDQTLSDFATALPENFEIIDLRNAQPGMGFSWGRYGPQTEIRRCGNHKIFAYAAPKQKSGRGFIARLFGTH